MTPRDGTRPDADLHRRVAALEAENERLRAALTEAGLDIGEARAATADAEDATRLARADAAAAAAGHARAMAAGHAELADAAVLNTRLQDLNAALRASEERLDAVIESATDHAIVEMDFDGRITGWSPGAEHVLGWTAAEAIGQDGAIIWTEEDRAAGVPARERELADATGSAADERWHLRRDGTRFWGSGHLTPLHNGRPRGYLKVLRDRTAERRAEEALRNSERQFRTLADAAPALIWYNDASGANVFVNGHFTDYTGLRAEEISGERWHALVHPDEADGYIADYLAAVRDRRAWRNRNRVRRHDGIWRWFDNIAQPLFADDGRYLGHVGVSTDITDTMEAEAALHESEERQAFLLRLSDALRAGPDANAMIEAAARLLGERLDATRVMFAEFDESRAIANIFHGWFADGARPFPTVMSLAEYDGPILQDLKAGRSVRIDDAGEPPFDRPDLAAIAQLGVKALLSVPLVIGGRLVVNLSVHQHTARHWTDHEVQLVQQVAERLWPELVRARAEVALRDSEERFRGFAENSADVLWIVSGDGTQLEYLSPAFERVFGEPRERIMADLGRFMDLVHPDDREVVTRFMPRVLAGRSPSPTTGWCGRATGRSRICATPASRSAMPPGPWRASPASCRT